MGFEEYSARWLEMIRTEPNRSGKKRAVGTVRSYQGKVTGYLVPEFRNTPVREIDAARIKVMTDRLDQIPRRSTQTRSSTASLGRCSSCS